MSEEQDDFDNEEKARESETYREASQESPRNQHREKVRESLPTECFGQRATWAAFVFHLVFPMVFK